MDEGGPSSHVVNERLEAHVKALEQRALDAVKHGRVGVVADAILEEVLSIEEGALNAADVKVVRNVLDIAGTLVPSGAFAALEQVYAKAIRVLATHRQAIMADFSSRSIT